MKAQPLTLAIVYLTVVLDAAGIGLVLPMLPDLFAASGHEVDGLSYGLFLSLYAFMQFVFSPLLGSLSDRIGRKPVLIVSLAFAAVNYGLMAWIPPLWLLFLGRAIAGITGANMAVASACLTDVTEPDQRAARFGQLSAAFGVGFIAGPLLGGVLGDIGVNWPFAAAGVLMMANLALVVFFLRETRPTSTQGEVHVNPLGPLAAMGTFRPILPLLMTSALFAIIGEIGGSVWVIYTEQRFEWSGKMVGVSLAIFGLCHALVQAFMVGPMTKRFGDRATLLVGVGADALSYAALALIGKGWLVLALSPLFCLGGMGQSVWLAVVSRKVSEDSQGALQGVLASLASLAAIIGPVFFLSLYFATRQVFPGLVWIIGACLYLLVLPILLNRKTYA